MGKMGNRRYTSEFKQQTVRLADEMGSVFRAAKQLGIPGGSLQNWKTKQRQGKLKDSKNNMSMIGSENEQEELKRLRKENKELKDINHILKKCAAFFSQDHLK